MKFLGQELGVLKNQVLALVYNLQAYFFSTFLGFMFPPRALINDKPSCVQINGPGGYDQLQLEPLESDNGDSKVTIGYNAPKYGLTKPYVSIDNSKSYDEQFHEDLLLVEIEYFSINYADICIRWGLYESALRYVGWPICPGFDFSGRIIWAGKKAISKSFQVNDLIFGVTLFGAYSKRVLVPYNQIRKTPLNKISQDKVAAVPAAVATALHAVALSRNWPQKCMTQNKGVMIHSAAGGVGSQLISICKIQGMRPIVGVVGSTQKVDYCKQLGCDYVIDKSKEDLWGRAIEICPDGFNSIFDANGPETMSRSYDALSKCGSLVVYGVHSMLPRGAGFLSPLTWIKMILSILNIPKFDPMQMILSSKSVNGFNLSFFGDEVDIIEAYFDQIVDWIKEDKIIIPDVVKFDLVDIRKAHELIQSGESKGKIVVKT